MNVSISRTVVFVKQMFPWRLSGYLIIKEDKENGTVRYDEGLGWYGSIWMLTVAPGMICFISNSR
jgi:hypothetical protein